MQYLREARFHTLLREIQKSHAVYVPSRVGARRLYRQLNGETKNIVIGEVRATEPLKPYFARARETIVEDFGAEPPRARGRPACIVGVKACDLKGFKVLDCVFRDQAPSDPFYERFRAQNLIIAADCTCVVDTCFCLAMGVQPHPQDDFDLCLSEVAGGFLVEAGSAKGEELMARHATLFEPADGSLLDQRRQQREQVSGEVRANIETHKVPDQAALEGAVARHYDSALWEDEAKTCVECGACNTVCPTCHCFFLCDQQNASRFARFRLWDSCLIKDFARVAGGGNPRPRLWMRLRNRFEKKFDFFPKVAGVYACTGCGRCVAACPAKIDIRRVLRRLATR